MSSTATWWAAPAYGRAAAVEIRESRVAYWALVAFSYVLLLSPQYKFPFLQPLRIAFLSAGISAAALLWHRWSHGISLYLDREIVVALVILAWAIVTVPLSYWPGGSVGTISDYYVKSVIVFWLLANVVCTTAYLRTLALVLTACSVPLAYTGLGNYLSGNFINEDKVARIAGYETGLASNPNDLALMLNLLIPLGIALLMGTKSVMLRIALAAALVIDVIGVIITYSRAGFLALAALICVYIVKMVRRGGRDRSVALAMLAAAVLSIPLLPASYMDRLSSVKSVDADETGSSQVRWADMLTAIEFVQRHPIVGGGIGMNILSLDTVRGHSGHMVHNVYLVYAVDLGLPGLTLFLILMYGAFKAASGSRKRLTDDPAHRQLFLLAEGVEISLIVFMVAGPFYPVAYHFYFYLIAGLALAARSITNKVLATA